MEGNHIKQYKAAHVRCRWRNQKEFVYKLLLHLTYSPDVTPNYRDYFQIQMPILRTSKNLMSEKDKKIGETMDKISIVQKRLRWRIKHFDFR